MAQMIQMTSEQLQQLIEAVRSPAANADISTVTKSKGSFSNCSSRFGGQRAHKDVEEFITSIVTYKEVEMISDEDALKGISLLFYGLASTWWQGVRKEAKTWNDVLTLIRDHFSPAKPAYQLYIEIFDNKQNNYDAIDTFVCEKRALFAQLHEGRHDEETELDFIYGLLNIKYRKSILRRSIKTFRELLEKGRIIENTLMSGDASSTGATRAPKRMSGNMMENVGNGTEHATAAKRNTTTTDPATCNNIIENFVIETPFVTTPKRTRARGSRRTAASRPVDYTE